MAKDFCEQCGANIPPIEGEGTCMHCDFKGCLRHWVRLGIEAAAANPGPVDNYEYQRDQGKLDILHELEEMIDEYSPLTKEQFQFVPTYTVAHLNWEGDGITALYCGDALVMSGDYYHDKIDDKIAGFFEGLEAAQHDYGRQDIYVSGEHFDECEAPSGLDELMEGYPWTEEP